MALLQLDRVSKHFGGLVAVDGVSLEVVSGEVMGLIGPNGAGKTTLFNIISGTFPPDSGRITFNGHDLSAIRPHSAARLGLARTFQIVKPFANLSVVDNVRVGAFLRNTGPGVALQKAQTIVDFVGLGAFAAIPARNLTTSGRKRLELARALATEPVMLLLDEVMAGLTPTESRQIVELIRQIRDEFGLTMLVIEHVMQAVMSLSDKIAVLHHGKLIAVDTPQVLARDPAVIEAYLGKEFDLAGS